MMQLAPPSASITYAWRYHVFLSFRGLDTRFGFTNNLHKALDRNGIRSFIDHEELKLGEEISPALMKAIEQSMIAIIVFSENYASSTFCLDELVKILECIKQKGRLVWPIFYKVEPSNVRYQTKSYEEAFKKHEKRIGNNSNKVQLWKWALHEASSLTGEHFKGDQYEYDFIARIVQQLSKIINPKPLGISGKYLVGLESRIHEVLSLLDDTNDETKCMVGICGIGGIGKSTIARVVFNLIADQFEGSCFLANVREISIGNRGLVQLQETLIYKILGEKKEFMDINEGSELIKDRLQQKKVLLILDDVDKLKQLRELAGGLEWFGSGSRIIITARDKHFLRAHGVERICEVEGLNNSEANELFCWNAFKKNEADPTYFEISRRAVHYCQGLPLALEIIGCNLFGKEPEECRSALDTYEKIPNNDIQEILKVSYDGLERNEKVIFLDMACFFNGYELKYVEDILQNSRGFDPKYGIGVLAEKSLIKIDHSISMHALIQNMGREIERQQSQLNPCEQSRLWCYKEIREILEENTGTNKIEFIMLDFPDNEEVEWDGDAFRNMKSLKALIIKNACFSDAPKYLPNSLRILHWKGYPLSSFPSNFRPRELAMLSLPNSSFMLDKQLLQRFKSLTSLDLTYNEILIQVPDISGLTNLRQLDVSGCINLTEIHDSVGYLKRLRKFFAAGCLNLRILPHIWKSASLSHLELSGCYNIQNIPEKFESFIDIHLCGNMADHHRPFVARGFETSGLMIPGPSGIFPLMSSISMLSILNKLVVGCPEWFSRVAYLTVRGCVFGDEVPVTMLSSFSNLSYLVLMYNDSRWMRKFFCKQFHCFSNLMVLDLTCNQLTDEFLSTWLPWFPNLTELVLTLNFFTILPACINQCFLLRILVLNDCTQLREIRGIPSNLKYLSARGCTSLTSESLSMLLSQEFHESGGTSFVLPGPNPDWFHHYCSGSSLSFWFREKFPRVAMCLSVDSYLEFNKFSVHMHVNQREIECDTKGALGYSSSQHVWLFDLQTTFESLWSDAEAEKEYIKNGWNHVEFKLVRITDRLNRRLNWVAEIGPREGEMGLYVYKQNPNTLDVRFTNPNI